MGSRLSPQEIQDAYGFDFTAEASEGWRDQLPMHAVEIDSGFWMAEREVTVMEWRAFIEATGYVTDAEREGWGYGWEDGNFGEVEGISWAAPGWDVEDLQPVTLLSWRDAQAYVAWRNEANDPHTYRLPTEAEWEFAARAGTHTNYFWGEDNEGAARHANVLDQLFGTDDGASQVTRVGSFEPNPWGLYDMIGNVWEWTSTPYRPYPLSDHTSEARTYVDRGGGWDSPPYNARMATRGAADDGFRAANLGLRLVAIGSSD